MSCFIASVAAALPLAKKKKKMEMNKGCSAKTIPYMQGKCGQAIKASARMNWITWMTHLVHFTSRRKGENMWKFNDPKRNIVFRKSDVKMVQQVIEVSEAKDAKNKTQNVANSLVLAQSVLRWCFPFDSVVFSLMVEHAYLPWHLCGYQLNGVQFSSLWRLEVTKVLKE